MEVIFNSLKEFRLSGMIQALETRLAYATANRLSYQEFLQLLCEDESNNRRDNNYKRRHANAKLPAHKTLAEFDFTFQPGLDQKRVSDVATGQFIRNKQNVILIGSPGTGKTHLAIAFALKALAQDYKVHFISVSDMLYQLHIAKADNSYHKKVQSFVSPDLLILDELGFKAVPHFAAEDFFNVITKRYEKGSTIITTNKPFEQWHEIFSDKVLTDAIIDRLIHHAILFPITGKSYRSKQEKKALSQNPSKNSTAPRGISS